MATGITGVSYTGATPGADSNDYTLFTTITNDWPARFFQLHGISKVVIDVQHTQNFTWKAYKSNDRGTSWEQVSNAAATASATGTSKVEWDVSPYIDFKVDITNGGVAQATWDVEIAMVEERSAAS